MLDDSLNEINSQHDSDVEPVQQNVELLDVTKEKPSYVRVPKTGGYCPLGSHQGKNPIGAPSTMKIDLKQIEVEETVSNKAKQFTDIISHKGRPTGHPDIDAFERDHPLKKIFEKTSWNNIPLPLKDILQVVINAVAVNEVRDWKRKKLINERFMNVYLNYDKLKERLKLVLAESRAQGVFIQEQIADIGPTCMQSVEAQFAEAEKELTESGQKIREQQQQMSYDIKMLVRGNLESIEKVDTKLKELTKIIDDLKEELPFRMEKNTRDYVKAWQKMPPQEGSGSLDIKDYLKLMPEQLGAEIKTLEGKLVSAIDDTRQDVQQTFASRIDQLTQSQLEVDALIRNQTKTQIESIENQLEVQTSQLRQEIKMESAQLRADDENRRMRERPTSADLRAKEQRELDTFKELTATSGGKDDPVNNKLANIVKMITRLQEELLPQKIQRAIEQFEGKLEVQAAKQKKLVKDSIGKVEKEQTSQGVRLEGFVMSQVDALRAKLGISFAKMIQSKLEQDPALSADNPLQKSMQKLELNSKETLELLPASRKTPTLNSVNSESKVSSSKRSEQQSPVGDYMEIFVSQNIKSRCDPLDDLGQQHGLMLKDVQKQIDQFGVRITKVDAHFNQTVRAICSTMGLVIRDVSGFTIQQEYIKKLDNEQKNRQKLKLGANVEGKNEYFKVMQQNESEHHSSIEGEQSDELSGSLESVEQINKSIDSSKPKHWRVIEKKFNLKGLEQSLQMDSQIRTNQSIDDSIYDKPRSQERQFEPLSPRQQVVHTSGKAQVSTLQENFLPVLKLALAKKQDVERITTTVQMTERYQKKAEFSKLQFPDVTQAQRSVHEGPRLSQGGKNNFQQTPTRISVHQSVTGSASLNIRRGKLPSK